MFEIWCFTFGIWLLVRFLHLPYIRNHSSQRLEILSNYPFAVIVHWLLGQIYLLLVFNSMELIQKVMVLFYLIFIRK